MQSLPDRSTDDMLRRLMAPLCGNAAELAAHSSDTSNPALQIAVMSSLWFIRVPSWVRHFCSDRISGAMQAGLVAPVVGLKTLEPVTPRSDPVPRYQNFKFVLENFAFLKKYFHIWKYCCKASTIAHLNMQPVV